MAATECHSPPGRRVSSPPGRGGGRGGERLGRSSRQGRPRVGRWGGRGGGGGGGEGGDGGGRGAPAGRGRTPVLLAVVPGGVLQPLGLLDAAREHLEVVPRRADSRQRRLRVLRHPGARAPPRPAPPPSSGPLCLPPPAPQANGSLPALAPSPWVPPSSRGGGPSSRPESCDLTLFSGRERWGPGGREASKGGGRGERPGRPPTASSGGGRRTCRVRLGSGSGGPGRSSS